METQLGCEKLKSRGRSDAACLARTGRPRSDQKDMRKHFYYCVREKEAWKPWEPELDVFATRLGKAVVSKQKCILGETSIGRLLINN